LVGVLVVLLLSCSPCMLFLPLTWGPLGLSAAVVRCRALRGRSDAGLTPTSQTLRSWLPAGAGRLTASGPFD